MYRRSPTNLNSDCFRLDERRSWVVSGGGVS